MSINIFVFQSKNKSVSILLITHYQRILRYVKPDFVHILLNGKIIRSGNYSLADDIELNGYNQYMVKTQH